MFPWFDLTQVHKLAVRQLQDRIKRNQYSDDVVEMSYNQYRVECYMPMKDSEWCSLITELADLLIIRPGHAEFISYLTYRWLSAKL